MSLKSEKPDEKLVPASYCNFRNMEQTGLLLLSPEG